MDDRRCVVLGVLTFAVRIGQNRSAQYVIRIHVSTANTFIDDVIERHIGIPLNIHTHGDKHRHNAGVLTQRSLALCAHSGIDQDLGHRVLGSLRLFLFIGFIHTLDKILRVVIGDKLQCISNAFDQVVLANHCGHIGSHQFFGSICGHQRCDSHCRPMIRKSAP